ncbi:hypothetical protein K8I85_04260, partial [bacterium]|nr:hypothetical protein [bacterium]
MRLRNGLLRATRSLQSRFMISVAVLLVFLTGAISLAVHDRLTRLLLRETRAKGVAIAQSIGATTTNALLNYDYVSLAQAAHKSVAKGGIAYVIVLDKEGKVAAHSERPDLVGLEIGVAASGVADPDQREARLQNTVVGAGSERTR